MSLRVERDAVYVSGDTFFALVQGERSPDRERAEQVAGVGDALEAARAAVVSVRVEVQTPTSSFVHAAWVAPSGMALLLDRGTPEAHLIGLPPDYLPVSLARMVALGPRIDADQHQCELPADRLEAFYAVDADVRRAALTAVRADRAWTISALKLDGQPEDVIDLAAIDGPAGLRRIVPSGEAFTLTPTSPTLAYQVFTGLLPTLA